MYAKDQSAIMTFATQNTKANLSTTLLSCLFVLVCLHFCLYFLSIMFATVRRQNPISRSRSRTRKRKMGRRKREIWFCHWTGRRWKLISCSPSGSLRTGRLLLCFALADVDEVLSKSEKSSSKQVLNQGLSKSEINC